MFMPGHAGGFSTFQIWIFFYHVFPELILPPGQLFLISKNLFCTEPPILGYRDKGKVHMWSFLVHMHHSRKDCFWILIFLYKFQSCLEIRSDFTLFLTFEKFWCGSNQGFNNTYTVFACPASVFFNQSIRFCPVLSDWFNQVIIQIFSTVIYIQIAGIFSFFPFIMCFNIADFRSFVFCKP